MMGPGYFLQKWQFSISDGSIVFYLSVFVLKIYSMSFAELSLNLLSETYGSGALDSEAVGSRAKGSIAADSGSTFFSFYFMAIFLALTLISISSYIFY